MAGFDNGTLQSGLYAQTKQFGSILRGTGDPVPAVGVVGDVYIDTQTWFLFNRRSGSGSNPWGNYLFAVPAAYQAGLKWFSISQPDNTVGQNGDYCLMWGASGNYGMQPSILGPKAGGAWPGASAAVAVNINPIYSADNQHQV